MESLPRGRNEHPSWPAGWVGRDRGEQPLRRAIFSCYRPRGVILGLDLGVAATGGALVGLVIGAAGAPALAPGLVVYGFARVYEPPGLCAELLFLVLASGAALLVVPLRTGAVASTTRRRDPALVNREAIEVIGEVHRA